MAKGKGSLPVEKENASRRKHRTDPLGIVTLQAKKERNRFAFASEAPLMRPCSVLAPILRSSKETTNSREDP
jgi:hypothetical protein